MLHRKSCFGVLETGNQLRVEAISSWEAGSLQIMDGPTPILSPGRNQGNRHILACILIASELGDTRLARCSRLVSALSCPPHLRLPEPKHPVPPSSCGCSGDDVNKFEPSMGHSACLDVSHNTAQTYLALPDSSGNSLSCFCPASGPFLRTFPGYDLGPEVFIVGSFGGQHVRNSPKPRVI